MIEYREFVAKKQFRVIESGFDADLCGYPLMPFQRDIVAWACNRGRAAIFADTGLGKTLMQLVWAEQVYAVTGLPVLVLAPLAVGAQTVREGAKFGIPCMFANCQAQASGGVVVTNYEKLHHFDASRFSGVVLDESSILKGMNGKLRKQITETFKHTPYKLSCTATPSPNDFMEIGTQSEFLGLMSQTEMLAMFFIHDGGDTSKWRLKGHGRSKFWQWLATWAVVIRSPADFGYDSTGYDLPPLKIHDHVVESGILDGLLPHLAQSLSERQQARRETIDRRVAKAAEIAQKASPMLVWCNMNEESQKLAKSIPGSVEVTGSDTQERKESMLLGFTDGEVQRLISKPKIAGFGMNWQHCNSMIFVGLSDSFEQYYQAVRRCWRFGQTKPVDVHIVTSDSEGAVVENIKRKQQQHDEIGAKMIEVMREHTMVQLGKASTIKTNYIPAQKMELPRWMA